MTDIEIPNFRDLYDEVLSYRRHALFEDVLLPWVGKAESAIDALMPFKSYAPYTPNVESSQDAMWNLYALSRVNDLLLLSFQEPESNIAKVSAHEYQEFFSGFRMSVVPRRKFSPFYHEIVKVSYTQQDDAPIEVLRELWPGLKFGDLMFSRAGVEIIAGKKFVSKEIAERSILYFCHLRQGRQTNDLSLGWGSNSQWRTDFRRDYDSIGTLIYNADGKHKLNPEFSSEPRHDGLSVLERIELCKNRCFILTEKPDHDLWPYDDQVMESVID